VARLDGYRIADFLQRRKFLSARSGFCRTYHSGLYNWDDYKYRLKVRKISNIFQSIEEDYEQLPSIIGLAEIGAKSVLEDLTNENSPINDYEIIYQSSKDSRNLSVALLFDRKKFTLLKYQTLQFQLDKEKSLIPVIFCKQSFYTKKKASYFCYSSAFQKKS
jgi:hypothetical protein